jgi:hypothetical protein
MYAQQWVRSRIRRRHHSEAGRAGIAGGFFDNSPRQSLLFLQYSMTGKYKELNDLSLNRMALLLKVCFILQVIFLIVLFVTFAGHFGKRG